MPSAPESIGQLAVVVLFFMLFIGGVVWLLRRARGGTFEHPLEYYEGDPSGRTGMCCECFIRGVLAVYVVSDGKVITSVEEQDTCMACVHKLSRGADVDDDADWDGSGDPIELPEWLDTAD